MDCVKKELKELLEKYADIVTMDDLLLGQAIKKIAQSEEFKKDFAKIIHRCFELFYHINKLEEQNYQLKRQKENAENKSKDLTQTISGIAEAQHSLENMVQELKLIKTGLK